jgi:capsular polysaccharide export protein
MEAIGWGWKYCLRGVTAREARTALRELESKPYFLFALQLSGDYQIRNHSPFSDMRSAALYVMESFARHAPDDAHLLIKAHPFDTSMVKWPRYIRHHARRLGIRERVSYIDGGNLEQLAADTTGMVCVNSTSATLALAAGSPVCALGEAIYNLPGLTFRGHLDEFWTDPEPPEPEFYDAFRRILVDRCLVRGGLASESAVQTLIESIVRRLCSGETAPAEAIEESVLAK